MMVETTTRWVVVVFILLRKVFLQTKKNYQCQLLVLWYKSQNTVAPIQIPIHTGKAMK